VVLGTALAASLTALGPARGQQVLRNGFETREPLWVQGTSDVAFRATVHETTDATAHTGQYSEHVQITAEPGNYVYYTYPVGRAPVSEELNLSLWIKSNRPGVQLLARVVLPRERNPNNLEEPLTTLIRGDTYRLVSRWDRLEVRRAVKLVKEQQQVMRVELQRDVDFTDAYIDRLVLNVYGGPGVTDVWIDDLEAGPLVEASPFRPTSRPVTSVRPEPAVVPRVPPSRAAVVELNQDQLQVNGKRFFFRGIRHSNTPLKTLRDAGFNAVWFDYGSSPAAVEEALNLGFWLIPALPVTAEDPRLASPESLQQEIGRFLDKDAVLFWDVGGGLTEEQVAVVSQAAQVLRSADPQRPIGADAWDGLRPYSRSVDLLGVHRWPLLTGLELSQYRDWLNQRRLLARHRMFLWTWVQTHLPDWYTTLVYDRPGTASFDEPIGPQPEQIRLLTYIALASGYRGLGFWSDRFLADSHQGRDRLLVLALLNQELRLLELLGVTQPPRSEDWIATSVPEVKAVVLRGERGVLVLPIWLGKGSQYVPGQAAASNLSLVVPQVPLGTQAWEISPAEVRSLRTERVVGGTKVTLPEFGLTAAVVFTADNGPNGLLVGLQEQTRRMRALAAQWSHDLAAEEINKVARVETELERGGHTLPDGPKLLENARTRLVASRDHRASGDHRQAYAEAERALRPLRILMRAQWERATRGLDLPVASPYAVSFFTLPRHWLFLDQVRQSTPGANVLPGGDFELSPDKPADAWQFQEAALAEDQVELMARRVANEPKEGRQCLMLKISPKNPQLAPVALERTYLAVNSPAVHLPPGQLVQISGWVRIPQPIRASVDGALLYDSAGGEPLAVRLTEPTPWKKFTLYREVPASGTLHVTLALTGLGTVHFDDIRVEPLESTAARSGAR
jgi:hypothetical protein